MQIFNWDIDVSTGFEVTSNEFGWLKKGQTFAINLKCLGVYIVFEKVHNNRKRKKLWK